MANVENLGYFELNGMFFEKQRKNCPKTAFRIVF